MRVTTKISEEPGLPQPESVAGLRKAPEDGWRCLNTLPFALYLLYITIQYLPTVLSQPQSINLSQSTEPNPICLIQSNSPTQPHSVHPRPVSLIHQIHSSQTHMLVNFTLVILSGHPWSNYSSAQYLTTQTVWKEGRKEGATK